MTTLSTTTLFAPVTLMPPSDHEPSTRLSAMRAPEPVRTMPDTDCEPPPGRTSSLRKIRARSPLTLMPSPKPPLELVPLTRKLSESVTRMPQLRPNRSLPRISLKEPPSIVTALPAAPANTSSTRLRLPPSVTIPKPKPPTVPLRTVRSSWPPVLSIPVGPPPPDAMPPNMPCPARSTSTPSAPMTNPGAWAQSRSPVRRTSAVTVSPQPTLCVVKRRSSPQLGPPCCSVSWAQTR